MQSKFTLSVRVTPKVNRKFSMQIYLSFVFCLALDSFPRWTVHVWGLLKQANINSLPHHCPLRTSSLHTNNLSLSHSLHCNQRSPHPSLLTQQFCIWEVNILAKDKSFEWQNKFCELLNEESISILQQINDWSHWMRLMQISVGWNEKNGMLCINTTTDVY